MIISIHAPREGCDRDYPWFKVWVFRDFNPRTPRGVRPLASRLDSAGCVISIHAPREGCDAKDYQGMVELMEFQSTHPARGATSTIHSTAAMIANFNPRTPRGVRPDAKCFMGSALMISIHAPREGCDPSQRTARLYAGYFNPRTPRGVRRMAAQILRGFSIISIHTPREGCDELIQTFGDLDEDFNPHTPRGVRRLAEEEHKTSAEFQSTHPARGATSLICPPGARCTENFNPHTPRGVRRPGCYPCKRPRHFNPHTPRGVRPGRYQVELYTSTISIHTPREGCDELQNSLRLLLS